MTETTFAQRLAGEGRRLPCWEAGSGETILVIVSGGRLLTRAHALLAERRRVIVFAMPEDTGTPQEAAQRIGATAAALGIEHLDLMGEGAGAAAALWLALAPGADIGSVVLAAPDGLSDEASAKCSGRCSCSPGRGTNPRPAIVIVRCFLIVTSCSSMTQAPPLAPNARRH